MVLRHSCFGLGLPWTLDAPPKRRVDLHDRSIQGGATVLSQLATAPRLRRALSLTDLVLYGVIVIQPVAPMPSLGVRSDTGHGHVVTAILIAMVAMLFTAISYGRTARVYPSAGSVFCCFGGI